MTRPADAIAEFHSLRPTRFPIVRRFAIDQAGGRKQCQLTLSVELIPDTAANERLALVFDRITDLRIDWPQWSVVRVDVIEIIDVSGHQLEGIQYRVAEGQGFFTFYCFDFRASVEQATAPDTSAVPGHGQ
jgi:hypothetical protein